MHVTICSPDILGPIRNGGVGTSCYWLARLLAKKKIRTRLCYTDPTLSENQIKVWRRFYSKDQIEFMVFPRPSFELQMGHEWARHSYVAYDFLKKESKMSLMVFPDMFGLGYFSQLARVNQQAFFDVPSLIKFLGPQVWSVEFNRQLIHGLENMSMPMIERRSVEMADVVQFATPWSYQWAKERGWQIGAHEFVLFPFDFPEEPLTARPQGQPIKEIVFFGRLEHRKGLETFLDALDLLGAEQLRKKQITFLGSPGHIRHLRGHTHVQRWAARKNLNIRLITGLSSPEAIDYLRSRPCLAVVPSLSETMGYTLVECLAHNIPVIFSDLEPFQTVSQGQFSDCMFKTGQPEDLARVLMSGRFAQGAEITKTLHQKTEESWLGLIEKTAKEPKRNKPKVVGGSVSVILTHFNRTRLLRQALKSLLMQKLSPKEVLIYDDASTDPSLSQIMPEFENEFKKVGCQLRLVVSKRNHGPAYGRNLLAKQASGQFLLFMDDDNLALPNEIQTLLEIQKSQDADVVTTAFSKFNEILGPYWMERRWSPVGFDISANIIENLMGDTNFLVRKDTFLELNGFDEDPSLHAEDFDFLMRASLTQKKMALSAEPLFLYRVHETNRSTKLDDHKSRLTRMRRILESISKQDMTSLSHMLLYSAYQQDLDVAGEPPFFPAIKDKKIVSRSQNVLKYSSKIFQFPRVEKFGISWRLCWPANLNAPEKQIVIDLSSLAFFKDQHVNLLGIEMICANEGLLVADHDPKQKLKVERGSNGGMFMLPAGQSRFRFSFRSSSPEIFLTKAFIAPVRDETSEFGDFLKVVLS